MTETEANLIAEAIRAAAPHDVLVEAVERHPRMHCYQVRCRYIGPTFIEAATTTTVLYPE